MREIIFTDRAKREYAAWVRSGRTDVADRIDRLVENAQIDPTDGIGKPERLRSNLTGMWSRRITHGDRLIYTFDETSLIIWQCMGHYADT